MFYLFLFVCRTIHSFSHGPALLFTRELKRTSAFLARCTRFFRKACTTGPSRPAPFNARSETAVQRCYSRQKRTSGFFFFFFAVNVAAVTELRISFILTRDSYTRFIGHMTVPAVLFNTKSYTRRRDGSNALPF